MKVAWIGTSLQVIGATMLASHGVEPEIAYVVMLPGSIINLGVALGRRDGPQIPLWAVFVGINFIGIFRWGA